MRALEESMRWYGPQDGVSLSDIRQAGAVSVVTALHEIPNGRVWAEEAILARKATIEASGLQWKVVESVPVHEDIKLRTGAYHDYIENYKQTIRNLAKAEIEVICYNFMPLLDWTRTDLDYSLDDGGKALRFEMKALAAFDRYILKRRGAEKDYSPRILKEAEAHFKKLGESGIKKLTLTILAGLPGAEEGYDLEDFKQSLGHYQNTDGSKLAEHLSLFLEDIIPVAEASGLKMAIHPDDPPYSILGLPRVVSTASDIERILARPNSPSNGLTFCTGSFGVRADNNLPTMVNRFKDRIHFVHLRSTQRDSHGNFVEAPHLEGDVPMFEVVSNLMKDNYSAASLPMRPDHGHQLLDDLMKDSNPGYSAIGRLKGLAELRGLMYAIKKQGMC
jgi:mannonate dehydratase